MTVLVPPRIAIKEILFPTDFSAASAEALPYAVSIAQQYDSRIHLFHVLTPVEWQVTPGAEPIGTFELGVQNASERMAKFIKNARFNGIQYDSAIANGVDIGQTVCEVADSRDIDLVIVGTSGREGLQRLFAGSIAEEVFRAVSCPVLVVGPRAACRVPRKLQRCLFATDLTKDSLAALPFVMGFAADHHARVIVAHVPPHKEAEHGVTDAVRKLMSDLIPVHDNVELEVPFGHPAEAILKLAENRQCDLIMLGAHHANAVATHLPANFAHTVVDEAYCPVLIVRPLNEE